MINKYSYIKLGISVILFIVLMVFFGYSLKSYKEIDQANNQEFDSKLEQQLVDSNLENNPEAQALVADFKEKQQDMKVKQSVVTILVMVGLLVLIVMEGSYLMTKSFKN